MFVDKYRPKIEEQVIGDSQRQVLNLLKNKLRKKEPAKIIMLIGSSGIGKTTIAKIYSSWILCENPIIVDNEIDVRDKHHANIKTGSIKPCGECNGCVLSETNTHYINCAADNGIDVARELASKMNYTGFGSPAKVYILDEIQGLTKAAQNALLTPLENLPPQTYFIFCTTDETAVIEPLKSRAQVFKLQTPSHKEMARLIGGISSADGNKDLITKDVILNLIESANGNIRTLVQNTEKALAGGIDSINLLNVPEEERGETGDLLRAIFYEKNLNLSKWIALADTIPDYNKSLNGLASYAIKLLIKSKDARLLEIAESVLWNFGEGLNQRVSPKIAFTKILVATFNDIKGKDVV